MKKVIKKMTALFLGANVYANHTAIKGKKSNGCEDSNSYKHWRATTGSPGDSIN